MEYIRLFYFQRPVRRRRRSKRVRRHADLSNHRRRNADDTARVAGGGGRVAAAAGGAAALHAAAVGGGRLPGVGRGCLCRAQGRYGHHKVKIISVIRLDLENQIKMIENRLIFNFKVTSIT